MCLALSVPWVLYHSFCRALNKQVPLLELQLSKLKIYALTVCILSMCSRLRLTAFSWYAEECVFVQSTSFTQFPYLPITGLAGQLALMLRISIMAESNIPGPNLPVTLLHLPDCGNLLTKMIESVAGQHPSQWQSTLPDSYRALPRD